MKKFNIFVFVLSIIFVITGCLPKGKKTEVSEARPPVAITPQVPEKPAPPPPPPITTTKPSQQPTTTQPSQQPTTTQPPSTTKPPSPPVSPPSQKTTTAPSTVQKVFGYRVQVFAFKSSKRADEAAKKVKMRLGNQKVYVVYKDGYYKVQVGNFLSQSEADSLKVKLRKMGYKDAFVVKSYIEIQ